MKITVPGPSLFQISEGSGDATRGLKGCSIGPKKRVLTLRKSSLTHTKHRGLDKIILKRKICSK